MDDLELAGVSLRQYAAVYAALAEGFPLDVVLDADNLSPGEWATIDEAWNDAIVADLRAGGTLSDDFDAATLALQDEYGRPLPPIDEDVAAWSALVRCWSAADDPAAFLRARGLSAADMARLHRRWSERLAVDGGTLCEAIATALARRDDLPPFTAPPLELRRAGIRGRATSATPFPERERGARIPSMRAALPSADGTSPKVSRSRERAPELDDTATAMDGALPEAARHSAAATRPTAPTVVPVDPFAAFAIGAGLEIPDVEAVPPKDPSLSDELTLVQHAAVCAELEVRPHDTEAILTKYGLSEPSRRERLDRDWRERLETETNVYAEWRRLYQHFRDHFASMTDDRGFARETTA